MSASGPRLVFYGDDFTGSTDALEVLAFAGLRTILFLTPPAPGMLARFPGLDAIGVAGDSRGMSVAELDAAMPATLQALRATGAEIVHYKVCSTFDSSPATGSIGRVIAIARDIFRNAVTPIVGGTPALARYCVFGNLFARSGTDGRVYRIDRHPIMSVHPVTPMHEGDLTRHLAMQADLDIASLGYPDLDQGLEIARTALSTIKAMKPDAVLIDTINDTQLTIIGQLLSSEAVSGEPLFVVGGSGVEYALTRWWRTEHHRAAGRAYPTPASADRVLVLSGSASRLTATQIDAAVAAGFIDMPIDPVALLNENEAVADALVASASLALEQGRSLILHSARGPDDPRIDVLKNAEARGGAHADLGRRLGVAMGRVLTAVQARTNVRRLVVAGGDTSSQVVQVLAPDALEVVARLTPGAPLCRMHAAGRSLDGVEIVLKGGQMGGIDVFDVARTGHVASDA